MKLVNVRYDPPCTKAHTHRVFTGERTWQWIRGDDLLVVTIQRNGIERFWTFCPDCKFQLGYVLPHAFVASLNEEAIPDYLLKDLIYN